MSRLLTSLTARALSFAHLAGVGAGPARASNDDDDGKKPPKDDDDKAKGAKGAKGGKADDDERKKGDDESDEDYDKRMKALDDEDDKKAKGAKGAKGGKADGDDDDPSAADDDPDEEMRGSSVAAAARRREQARCASIFASPIAGKNPVLAAKLAFTTRMPRDEALAILEGTPVPTAALPSNVASRATRNPNLSGGDAPKLTGQASIDASWDAARKANQKAGR